MAHDFSGNSAPSGYFEELRTGSIRPLITGNGFDKTAFDADVPTTIYTAGSLTYSGINNAINTAAAAGGGIVRLPAGTGTIIGVISIQENILIEGAGPGKTILKKSGNINYIFDANDKKNFVLRDMTMDANNTDRYCIRLQHSSNFMLERVTFDDTANRSLLIIRYCNEFTVRFCTLSNAGKHGIAIKDCYENEGVSLGTAIYCAGQYTAGTNGAAWTQNFAIYSNIITGCGTHGLNNHGLLAEVAGNDFDGNNHAGKMFDGRALEYHRNWVRNNTYGFMTNHTLDPVTIPEHATGDIRLRCNYFDSNSSRDLYFGDGYGVGYAFPVILDNNTYASTPVITPSGIDQTDLLVCAGSGDLSGLSAGEYTNADTEICDGCSNDAQPPPENFNCSGNLIANGDFFDGMTDWIFATDGDGVVSSTTSEAMMAFGSTPGIYARLTHSNIVTAGSNHALAFQASAETETVFTVTLTDNSAVQSELTFNVGLTAKIFTAQVQPGTGDAAEIEFEFAPTTNSNVIIDNVCLMRLVAGEVFADFRADDVTIGAGESVVFTDMSHAAATITAWSWESNGVQFSTSQNPSQTFSVAGAYSILLTVTTVDGSDAMVRSDYIVVSPTSSQTLQVGASTDNAEDRDSGFGTGLLRTQKAVALRFVLDTAIPDGATITLATLELESDGGGTPYPTLVIRGENDTNPATYLDQTDYDARSETTASVSWTSYSWSSSGWYTTDDFSAVVQEILDDEAGLEINDSVAFHLNDEASQSGFIKIHSYDSGSLDAAKLNLTWTVPGSIDELGFQFLRIGSGSSDAERRTAGWSLSLGGLRTYQNAKCAMRFVFNDYIPADADIDDVRLRIYASGAGDASTFPYALTVQMEDNSNPATYTTDAEFDTRSAIAETESWSLASWTQYAWHESGDLGTMFSAWLKDKNAPINSGDSVAFWLSHTATAEFIKFAAYEYGIEFSAVLNIEWSKTGAAEVGRALEAGVTIGVEEGLS